MGGAKPRARIRLPYNLSTVLGDDESEVKDDENSCIGLLYLILYPIIIYPILSSTLWLRPT